MVVHTRIDGTCVEINPPLPHPSPLAITPSHDQGADPNSIARYPSVSGQCQTAQLSPSLLPVLDLKLFCSQECENASGERSHSGDNMVGHINSP